MAACSMRAAGTCIRSTTRLASPGRRGGRRADLRDAPGWTGSPRPTRCGIGAGEARIKARHLLWAANGYLGEMDRRIAAQVMPINNFIVATEPLGSAGRQS